MPRRGLEVGGLLLGEQGANKIEVKSLFPVTCRYPEGPAFRVSDGELREALQHAAKLGDVVGIYRSRTDGSLALDEQDSRLLQMLAHPLLPVLLIRQQKNKAGEVQLLLWDGQNGNDSVTPVGERFPINSWLSLRSAAPAESLSAPPDSAPDDGSAANSDLNPDNGFADTDEPAAKQPQSLSTTWIAALVSVVLLTIFTVWRIQTSRSATENRRSAQSQNPSPREVLQITPGKSQPEARPGLRGIADPAALPWLKKAIRSDKSQFVREAAVRELAILWKSDPEAFPLLRDRARSDDSEIVRAAALQEIARGWRQDAETRALLEDRARADRSAEVRHVATLELSRGPSTRTAALEADKVKPTEAPAEDSAVAVQPGPPRSFTPPPSPTPASSSFEAPPVPAEIATSSPTVPSIQMPPIPRASVTTPPVGVTPPSAVIITQPILAHQPRPVSLPPDLRRLVQHEVVLSLRISVDAKGRVLGVAPTDQAGKAERVLWSFYAEAIKSWTFEPARRNNVPIAGEAILRFRVTPNMTR